MTKSFIGTLARLGLICLWVTAGRPATSRDQATDQETKKEPLSEASRQWMEEVVPYIITAKERTVFVSLPTEKDRGDFILGFWKKRDPNPATPENEFKVEYYKRIGAANKLFGSGSIAGWRTDRGKFYILLGAPKEIQRDMNPGTTGNSLVSVFQGPKETWEYYGLPNPNLPYNLELVFVDKYGTGNFKLDNGFRVDSGGKRQYDPSELGYQFNNIELIAEAQRNPFEGFDKLKEIITSQVSYTHIPFRTSLFYFKGRENKVSVPLILELPSSTLTTKRTNNAERYSLYLILNVSNSLGQVIFEKSKDFNFAETRRDLGSGDREPFLIETALSLDPGSYKLHELVLDNFSGKVGTSLQELTVPAFGTEELMLSSIFLSSAPSGAPKNEGESPSPKGVRNRVSSRFRSGEEMNVYMEVYSLSLDPTSGLNRFKVEYEFFQGGVFLTRAPSPELKPTAEKDCRVQTSFRLKNFKPGEYLLKIKVTDELKGRSQAGETALTISG
jgi:GWxTD domain-containing protein